MSDVSTNSGYYTQSCPSTSSFSNQNTNDIGVTSVDTSPQLNNTGENLGFFSRLFTGKKTLNNVSKTYSSKYTDDINNKVARINTCDKTLKNKGAIIYLSIFLIASAPLVTVSLLFHFGIIVDIRAIFLTIIICAFFLILQPLVIPSIYDNSDYARSQASLLHELNNNIFSKVEIQDKNTYKSLMQVFDGYNSNMHFDSSRERYRKFVTSHANKTAYHKVIKQATHDFLKNIFMVIEEKMTEQDLQRISKEKLEYLNRLLTEELALKEFIANSTLCSFDSKKYGATGVVKYINLTEEQQKSLIEHIRSGIQLYLDNIQPNKK